MGAFDKFRNSSSYIFSFEFLEKMKILNKPHFLLIMDGLSAIMNVCKCKNVLEILVEIVHVINRLTKL